MIDVIAGEEPPIELGDDQTRSSIAPHPAWFLTTVVLQLFVLLIIGASKLHAMPPAKYVNVQALTGYVSHDKFRGNYISDVIFNADSASVLPSKLAKEVVLIVKTEKTVSALDPALQKWKFVRIESDLNCREILSSDEVALKAKVSPSRFQSGKQMISIHTTPFFVAEGTANSLELKDFSRRPAEFKLAVDKDGSASIVSCDTANWLNAKP